MLKSMTAYASLEQARDGLSAGVEIRTYNSRHLDVSLRLPAGYAVLEEKIKTLIGSFLVRGRAEVRLWVKDASEASSEFEVDLAKARAYHSAALELKQELAVSGEMTLDMFVAVPGIIQKAEQTENIEQHWPLIEQCLRESLATVDRMRCREGAHIEKDFAGRLTWMENRLDRIEASTQGLLEQYRDKLLARIEALTQGTVALDPARIAQEAAIIADRSDISEEIVRARSHIAQFRTTMQGGEPAGRKLNFLLQEFNREFNTMGSKVGNAELSHIIVAVKAEIEKLREQVQNIE